MREKSFDAILFVTPFSLFEVLAGILFVGGFLDTPVGLDAAWLPAFGEGGIEGGAFGVRGGMHGCWGV